MSGGDHQVDVNALLIGADDPRIRTQIGKREAGHIVSTGVSGMFIYGPYIALEAGAYTIRIEGAFAGNEAEGLDIEVTAECGDAYLVSRRLSSQEGGDYIADLSFVAEKPCRDVEIRIFADSGAEVRISRFVISRTGDAPLAHNGKQRVFDNGTTIADLTSIGSDTIVVSFQPYGFPGAEKRGFGEDIVPENGCDVLCFKPLVNNWYQDVSLESLNSVATSLLQRYRRRIGYGSSMGAYALFYFANVLQLDEIVALSPQYSVDPSVAEFENRWGELRSIAFNHRWNGGGGMKAYLFYDPFDAFDRWHFQRLREIFPAGQDYALPFSGHPTTTALVESRQLKRYIVDFIAGKVVGADDLKKKIRSMSYTYARLMILRAARREGLLSIRLFIYFARRLAMHGQWIVDTVAAIADEFLSRDKVFQTYLLTVVYAFFYRSDADRARAGELNYIRGLLPDQIRERFDIWFAGWKQNFTMGSEKIQTQVGARRGSSIVSNLSAGALVYGPYVDMPAGVFLVTLSGTAVDCGGVLIRITRDFGQTELISHTMSQNRGRFSLQFECYSPDALRALEIVVLVLQESDMTIEAIDIEVTELRLDSVHDVLRELT